MSKSSKPLTLARLEDITLGAFAVVPMSSTLKHLLTYLNTWSGTEKTFSVLQYSFKLLVPYLHWRARLQHQTGRRTAPTSDAAESLSKLAGLIGDAKTLISFSGILHMIQWLTSLERNPPPTRNLLTIERLQAWSLLLFYPLDHLSYLVSHSVVPAKTSSPLFTRARSITTKSSDGTLSLNTGKLTRLSCRFWALYIVLQLAHFREDRSILISEERSLNKSKAISARSAKLKVMQRWEYIYSDLLVNICNLPCALHWSLESGLFKNSVWVDVLSLIAAVLSWRSGWRSTAAPVPSSVGGDEEDKTALRSDLVTDLDIQAPIGLDAGLGEI